MNSIRLHLGDDKRAAADRSSNGHPHVRFCRRCDTYIEVTIFYYWHGTIPQSSTFFCVKFWCRAILIHRSPKLRGNLSSRITRKGWLSFLHRGLCRNTQGITIEHGPMNTAFQMTPACRIPWANSHSRANMNIQKRWAA